MIKAKQLQLEQGFKRELEEMFEAIIEEYTEDFKASEEIPNQELIEEMIEGIKNNMDTILFEYLSEIYYIYFNNKE